MSTKKEYIVFNSIFQKIEKEKNVQRLHISETFLNHYRKLKKDLA